MDGKILCEEKQNINETYISLFISILSVDVFPSFLENDILNVIISPCSNIFVMTKMKEKVQACLKATVFTLTVCLLGEKPNV